MSVSTSAVLPNSPLMHYSDSTLSVHIMCKLESPSQWGKESIVHQACSSNTDNLLEGMKPSCLIPVYLERGHGCTFQGTFRCWGSDTMCSRKKHGDNMPKTPNRQWLVLGKSLGYLISEMEMLMILHSVQCPGVELMRLGIEGLGPYTIELK